MAKEFDVCVIGSGPGGYVAAIRASQLGFSTAIIEKRHLGGVCLNIGCIPTKALLRSAEVLESIQHASDYGIEVSGSKADFGGMVKRSRGVANKMSKGVQFLMKANKIQVFMGTGVFASKNELQVQDESGKETERIKAKHFIIATGARPRVLPNLPIDGKMIIDSEAAMTMEKQPKKMVIVGAGAIGVEFAYFYHTIGTEVTLVELQKNLVPVEDADVGRELGKIYKKKGINILTESTVESVTKKGKGVEVTINTKKGEQIVEADVVLSAVGVTGNVEGLGLEEIGVKIERGAIVVDRSTYSTGVEGIYAVGDIIGAPWLAHKASHEAIVLVEQLAGKHPKAINYENIPGCTYCEPQVASVGMTEAAAKEAGYEVKVGKFPLSASGKATALGHEEGFVKVIFDAKYGEWLGCHMIGFGVTEMIAEAVVARDLETTGHEIISAVHPHPTLSEAVMEAVAEAYNEGVHLGTPVKH
ncbi:MAG: dihydrolipoyl dehydrogenase [Bacteroidetes bacterium]|jgi:dihydrolipoamide dehydrogenase|nr:dihydrolipoyl dehydrogenase [Bacteroidota bacterium]MDA1126480.1 dihydrolipoyl dehydrogenase [Bacteroidota bacterium]CAI8357395.1 MAG: Dihydrolipoyl dehydrogenase [Rhodothermaeota bacterium MED-G12]|tara:strand:- start:9357 stop:10775 length:1419 start_codon:yes stop_codon:yes gene_type:complete